MAPLDFENAETIDASPSGPLALRSASISAGGSRTGWNSRSGTGALRTAARGMVALVEGSSPRLSSETRDILRRRLRSVALILFAAFLAFLIRALFITDVDKLGGWFLLHVSVTALMGLMAAYLTWSGELSLTRLRIAELIVIGDPAIYFLMLTRQKLNLMANLSEGAHLPIVIVPWVLLIFTYALFIPNSWRRAAWVIGPLAMAPLAVIGFQRAMCPGFQACEHLLEYHSYTTEQAIVMAVVAVAAVLGVHTINTLRVEAFEARQLGQYVLRRKIGAGGMGEVYLAEHQMMKRPCAIKIIRPEKAGDPKTLARFEREVRSTAKLSHWNSIDIYDYGNTPDGTFYYVMEYLPGYNVGELVEQYGPLPPERVVYLIEQVCRRWPRRTASAWCTATSSRRISSAPTGAASTTSPNCSTSGSPSRSTRGSTPT